jgi:prepilin-type processing-associated H-X9-DG protein
MSEHVRANFSAATGGNKLAIEGIATGQTLQTSPGNCRTTTNGQFFNSSVTVKGRHGTVWTDGQAERVGFNTILAPNSPSCAEGSDPNADSANTVLSASSRHEGGVHCLMADGAVRFVTENIDTGNLGVGPNGNGPSPYGVWGAMGSKSGGEGMNNGANAYQ